MRRADAGSPAFMSIDNVRMKTVPSGTTALSPVDADAAPGMATANSAFAWSLQDGARIRYGTTPGVGSSGLVVWNNPVALSRRGNAVVVVVTGFRTSR